MPKCTSSAVVTPTAADDEDEDEDGVDAALARAAVDDVLCWVFAAPSTQATQLYLCVCRALLWLHAHSCFNLITSHLRAAFSPCKLDVMLSVSLIS